MLTGPVFEQPFDHSSSWKWFESKAEIEIGSSGMKESDLEAQAEAISTIVGASPRLWGGWVRYWRDEWDVSGALAIHLQPLNHCFDI